MSRNQKDDSPQRRAEPDQPSTDANKTVERDRLKVPVQPMDPEPTPAEKPAFDWVDHED